MTTSNKKPLPDKFSATAPTPSPREGEFLLYSTEDGKNVIQVRLHEENLWLSQKQLAELFLVTPSAINQHLRHIFTTGELASESVIKNFLTTASDGKNYQTKFYNLDVILAVGYRVRSHRGTQFRQWATEHLKEYLVKGFVLDDARLKEGYPRGMDYFDELLARIRDIRSSEKVLYHKLRDIFTLSTDYSSQAQKDLQRFFQTVQNKMHWAATEGTAAEITYSRADAGKVNMGLQTWAGPVVRRKDVTIAKNYLNADELDTLNRIVTMFLDQAEFRVKRRQAVYMHEWTEWLDKFLSGEELPVLQHLGKISGEMAKEKALTEYDKFHAARLAKESETLNLELAEHTEAALEAGAKAIDTLVRVVKK